MPYKLAEYHGDTLAVPQLLVSHLTQTDGDTIRAALYLLQTGDTDPRTMARALGLSSVEAAKRALQYWAGAGLLVYDRGAPIPSRRSPRRSTGQPEHPYAAVLCEEAQTAFGGVRSQRDAAFGRPVPDRRLAARRDFALLCRGCPPGEAHHRRRCAGTHPLAGGRRGDRRGCRALPAPLQAARAVVSRSRRAVWHCRRRPDPLGAQRHRPLARGMGHWPRDDRRSAAAGRQ